MTVDRDLDYLISLVHELRKLQKETEWAEFKHNIAEADEIGEYISALSNSAALCDALKYLIPDAQTAPNQLADTIVEQAAA